MEAMATIGTMGTEIMTICMVIKRMITLNGGNHNNTLDVGQGDDTLQGKRGVDTIYGVEGHDFIDHGDKESRYMAGMEMTNY